MDQPYQPAFSMVQTKGSSLDYVVQVHGGAWDIPQSLKEAHRAGVVAAYDYAVSRLQSGKDPMDTIVEVLGILEDDPVFDAGSGSFLNEHGVVELDAAVMEGAGLRAGAVAALGSFPNPSRIARAVMDCTDHVLLVGTGAEDFAMSQGFRKVDISVLVHEREITAHRAWLASGKPDAKTFFSNPETKSRSGPEPDRRGTVGVVLGVKNKTGHFCLFSGTSTGGTPGKKAGRVGDVPLVGCGIYADNEGAAVSCTGWGEGLTRIVAAKSVSQRVTAGQHPQQAIEAVLQEMWRRTGGRGGIIAVDREGRCGAAFSTPDMAFAGSGCKQIFP
ncbi:MAG TPA: isoaspartyl peptidase/L-asparaginase [Oligoflexus sp.]|uniref:isoaspartyl peptidase/L-asparaginase family protein n=1 Tax=Oligoflexus sp. TaxID=1971216 RepID=UPI002D5D5568|nr:isoaspartyl peptidase/L-asparaginase [Oligoflexus sp.]HYX34879.1 isoaspartyl peptidase/L-asparaginase [Oligoflexus sp.]